MRLTHTRSLTSFVFTVALSIADAKQSIASFFFRFDVSPLLGYSP